MAASSPSIAPAKSCGVQRRRDVSPRDDVKGPARSRDLPVTARQPRNLLSTVSRAAIPYLVVREPRIGRSVSSHLAPTSAVFQLNGGTQIASQARFPPRLPV